MGVSGAVLFSHGFRPFFLGGALWAALAMALWMGMLGGHFRLPTAFDAVSWHAHEFLFGYGGAIIAGFLLTATPSWTGRPLTGWALAGLAALWLSGRVLVGVSAALPPALVAAVTLAFPVLLFVIIAHALIAGRNRRNLILLPLLGAFIAGQALFHWTAAQGGFPAQGEGLRLALGAMILLLALIGGRVIPAFTRNWLAQNGAVAMPVMTAFDRGALAALLLAIGLWVWVPGLQITGGALILAGLLHTARLLRWSGHRTLGEPLIASLHVGYGLLAGGAILLGAEIVLRGAAAPAPAQHVWMAGAIGLTSLAIMTRATLGHTGRPLTAGPITVALYSALLLSMAARVGAGYWVAEADDLHALAALWWIVAFAGFAAAYGPALTRPRRDA